MEIFRKMYGRKSNEETQKINEKGILLIICQELRKSNLIKNDDKSVFRGCWKLCSEQNDIHEMIGMQVQKYITLRQTSKIPSATIIDEHSLTYLDLFRENLAYCMER